MILGANFASESGPEIPLNVSLLIRFGGHVTMKKRTTWLLITKKGATCDVSPPRWCRGSPRCCCLSNVCRRPPPRSRLPVRVADPSPRQVKAAQEAGKPGGGRARLGLDWCGTLE